MAGLADLSAAIRNALVAAGYAPTDANMAKATQLWQTMYASNPNLTTSTFVQAIRYAFTATGDAPGAPTFPTYTASQPAASSTLAAPTGGGGAVFTGTGTAGTSEIMNPTERQNQWNQQLQAQDEAAAMARQQASSAAQTAAAQISAQAQVQAQEEADRAALERLRYQLGNDLASALMTNDLNKAQLTIDVANLAADPRSTVAFLEYLGKQGGGPTAISQGLVAGQTPSPVWDVIPQTQGYSSDVQSLIDQLQGFIGG